MTIDLDLERRFSDVVYLSRKIPPDFPRPRIESRGLLATGAMISSSSTPSILRYVYFFVPVSPVMEFERHIYLRSTNFVDGPRRGNDYYLLEVQRKFHAGAQIGRDTSLHDRKVFSIRRARLQGVFLGRPIFERGYL